MAETIGQLVDRLAELELHRWHVEQLMRDPACLPAQVDTCHEHLKELDRQRSLLQQRIGRLWADRHGAGNNAETRSPPASGVPQLQAVESEPEDPEPSSDDES